MSSPADPPDLDSRRPRRVYAVGSEPDPRFTFANERTFLAWIRTGLGFLAAGVGLVAVAQLNASLGLEVRIASVLLILCGLVCGIGAYARWMRNEQALRLSQPLPSSRLIPFLTIGVVLVALVAFAVVTLQ